MDDTDFLDDVLELARGLHRSEHLKVEVHRNADGSPTAHVRVTHIASGMSVVSSAYDSHRQNLLHALLALRVTLDGARLD